MDDDIRETEVYKAAEQHYTDLLGPGFGTITGGIEHHVSPDGRHVAFTGGRMEKLEGQAATRVCVADLEGGDFRQVTDSQGNDRLPRWSPDSTKLAFLSDRAQTGWYQLYLFDADRVGDARRTPEVPGVVEYLDWSPDGTRILLGVAGYGADLAGGQGSGTTVVKDQEPRPDWLPEIEAGVREEAWRTLWLYDVGEGSVRRLSRPGLNVWEATWAGPAQIAAVVSEAPGEEAWYSAPLALIDAGTGDERVLYRSERQLGLPRASSSGARLAVIQAVCSDRMIVAGDVLLVDVETGATRPLDSSGVDVTDLGWRDDETLLFAGLRGLTTVVGEIDAAQGKAEELWASNLTCGGRYPELAVAPDGFVIQVDGWDTFPELVRVRNGEPERVVAFEHPGADYLRSIGGRCEEVSWRAPDGLEIEGLLYVPERPAPHPLIMLVHGGPVWAYRNKYCSFYSYVTFMVKRGFAVLTPNPRGSTGRGQAFAGLVFGDMGGDDTYDLISGVEAMVERGIADPARIGVSGGSYGGYMAAWIITKTDLFAASVPQAPVTNWYSQHHTSNIPYFDALFLQDDPRAPGGRYYERSPVFFAHKARTPTLQTTGTLDKCTPPTQALEFHRALVEAGCESAVAIYPNEGHGVRQYPAYIEHTARMVAWFERFMAPVPAEGAR